MDTDILQTGVIGVISFGAVQTLKLYVPNLRGVGVLVAVFVLAMACSFLVALSKAPLTPQATAHAAIQGVVAWLAALGSHGGIKTAIEAKVSTPATEAGEGEGNGQ